MVVVVLIGLIAVIATPSMSVARADRLAFDFARNASQLLHNGRARSAGRGAAHLALYTQGAGRGAVRVFESLDGTAPPTGPGPSAACRASGQWGFAETFVPGTVDGTNRARFIDGFTIDTAEGASVIVKEDIKMTGFQNDAGARTAAPAIAVCTTPNGTTFVGTGANAAAAISAMSGSAPFTGVVELLVERHRAGASVGLRRRVIVAGGAAPRIKSE